MSGLTNPFVGLRPFEAADSLFYFGRREQTAELLTYLRRERFLAVVGSSGSGKSSLVRAGLVPNLEAGFLVHDRDTWYIARMKPGDGPFDNLAHALLRAVSEKIPDAKETTDLAAGLRNKGMAAAIELLKPVLGDGDGNLFLLVDQFEEIFRLGVRSGDQKKRRDATAFVDLLLRMAGGNELPVYVCVTMRSDYIGDCDAFSGLPEAMNRSQYLVPKLTREQRRQVIEGPIRLSGAGVTDRLVNRLLNESGEFRDDLPVLQHALMRTWDYWYTQGGDGDIDTVHYEAIHTMKAALSSHADEALRELSKEDQLVARSVFQLLTETDAENRRIRRARHLNEIAAVTGAEPGRLLGIIDVFCREGRAFLIVSSKNPDDNPLVDISHESLMRQWETLEKWMDKEAESADIYRRLADAAELYKQEKGGLYTDPALMLALEWREKHQPKKEWAKRYHPDFDGAMAFLEESRKDRDNKKLEEERRRKQTLRRTRVFTVVITVFFLIAVGMAFWALRNAKEARKQTLEASYNMARIFDSKTMNELKLERIIADASRCKAAWLYMTAALRQEIPEGKCHLSPKSISVLINPSVIDMAFRERWISVAPIAHAKSVNTVTFSPYGNIAVSGSSDKILRLWNLKPIKEAAILIGHTQPINTVTFSPYGKTIVSGSSDKTLHLWDMETKKEIVILNGHTDWVRSIDVSSNGKFIVSGSDDKTLLLWDMETKKEIATLNGHRGTIWSVSFSPNGNTIASGSSDKTLRLWNIETKKEIAILNGHKGVIWSVTFSPDGKTIVSGSSDKTLRLWDMETKKEIAILNGHTDWIRSIDVSPDGSTIVSGADDNTLRLWDMETKKEIAILSGHTQPVNSVVFSPDGNTILSGANDNTLRLWDARNKKDRTTLTGNIEIIWSVAFSPNGSTIVSGADDNTLRLWDMETKKEIAILKGHSQPVNSVAFSPDGSTVVSGSDDNTLRLWDMETKKEIAILEGHTQPVNSVVFSPDGSTIVSGSNDKTLRLWSINTQKEISLLKEYDSAVLAVAFSPDGNTIASGLLDGALRLWGVDAQKEIGVLFGHTQPVNSVAFSPNGNTIVSGSDDKTLRLWDVSTQKKLTVLTGHNGYIYSVAFSPDGNTIVSGSDDSTLRLWDVETQKEITSLQGHIADVNTVAFSPDGNTIVSGSDDYTLRTWDVGPCNDFLKHGKPTPLFFTFAEGVDFFWGVRLNGFEYEYATKRHDLTLEFDDGTTKTYDESFRPLLDEPAPDQNKFDQILEWAKDKESKR